MQTLSLFREGMSGAMKNAILHAPSGSIYSNVVAYTSIRVYVDLIFFRSANRIVSVEREREREQPYTSSAEQRDMRFSLHFLTVYPI